MPQRYAFGLRPGWHDLANGEGALCRIAARTHMAACGAASPNAKGRVERQGKVVHLDVTHLTDASRQERATEGGMGKLVCPCDRAASLEAP